MVTLTACASFYVIRQSTERFLEAERNETGGNLDESFESEEDDNDEDTEDEKEDDDFENNDVDIEVL